MEVKYKFVNGDAVTVEVAEDIGEAIVVSRREENTPKRFWERHSISLDAITYEGVEFGDSRMAPEAMHLARINAEEAAAKKERDLSILPQAMASLTETQRRRVMMRFVDGLTYREIARREGISDHKAIKESVDGAMKKLRKFFK